MKVASELEAMKKSLANLVNWMKEIDRYSLERLKTELIFNSESSPVNLVAHEAHLLKINAKKKEEKFHFLSKFFESFGSSKTNEEILKKAFSLLNSHLDNSDAVLFEKKGDTFQAVEESFYNFLNTPLTPEIVQECLPNPLEEIHIINTVDKDSILFDFFFTEEPFFGEGARFMFVRLHGFDFIMCFFRSFGSTNFSEFETEFIQVTAEKLRQHSGNIQRLENQFRMEQELQTAATVQQTLFPKTIPNIENLKIATYFQSASETGGDWYGFMQMNNDFYILIGDVTGHGTPTALVTASASATCATIEKMHVLEQKVFSPSEVLQYLNHNILETGQRKYLMTFVVAAINLETGMMTFSNAGHNFPFMLRNQRVKPLLNRNLRLGDQADVSFTQTSVQLMKDDLLFFYTDGLIENENPAGEMFGEKRTHHILLENSEKDMQHILDTLVEETAQFYQDEPLGDDLTMVALRYLGS